MYRGPRWKVYNRAFEWHLTEVRTSNKTILGVQWNQISLFDELLHVKNTRSRLRHRLQLHFTLPERSDL